MKFNQQSVIKAAIVGVVINTILAILTNGIVLAGLGDSVLGLVNGLLLCCAGLLVPIGVGALYGYFTPGREEMSESAAGGAVTGIVAGLAFGVVNALMTAVVALIEGFDVIDAVAGATGTIVGACCGAFIFGAILGAIGGVIWGVVQKDKM